MLSLRQYQKRLADVAVAHNSIVLLPTGSGKTIIAAELILRLSQGRPAVFFVPTRDLVEQQSAAIKSWAPSLEVGQLHGGLRVPSGFDVLVTLPQKFDVEQGRGEESLQWSKFGVVIFDEVHHVLKDHPYRKLALSLKKQASLRPRVVGLSASLTYNVGERAVLSSVQRICDELCIEKLLTATEEELRRDGYHASKLVAEVVVRTTSSVGVVPLAERKPHLMLQTFTRRVEARTATAFSLELVDRISALEKKAGITSLMQSTSSMKKWGERASKLKAPWSDLEHWYEALRLHVASWEEIPEQAAAYLLMMTTVEAAFESRLKTMVSSSARFGELRAQLREKQAKRGAAFRGIIFVQQRVMTHVLDYVISNSSSNEDCSLGAVCLYAQGPVNPSWGLSKEESRERLRKFRSGESKLLIATMAAEEGLDVPESNVVICYDEMQHSVSLVQRRGRARQEGSDFVVLRERPDRPVVLLEKIERQQQDIIGSFQPRQETAESAALLKAAQRSRERGAATVLNDETNSNEVATLNLYCKKTKVPLAEKWREGACFLSYESPLRSLEASAEGINRKAAKRKAASQLLNDLRADLETSPHY